MGQLEEHAHLPVLAAVVVCESDRCQRLASSSHSLDHRTQTAVHTGPIVVNVSLRLVTVSIIGRRRLSILVPSLSTFLFVL